MTDLRHACLAAIFFAACSKSAPDDKTTTQASVSKADGPAAVDGAEPKAATKPGAKTWTFDAEEGDTPAQFQLTETAGQGTPATWKLIEHPDAPSPPTVFGITETSNDKRTYNVALASETSYGDVDVSVMVRAVTGELDQGGGPIWRAKDADNYYIARWNPLEKNVRFYVVLDGHRTTLAKADLDLPKDAWHELRVVHTGEHLQCFVDDEPVMNIADASLREPGMIGLWTKADAATLFDDLSIAVP